MGLGIRAWNEIDKNQDIWWAVELRTAPGFAEENQEPRSWVLPPAASLKYTWSTCIAPTKGNPTLAALEIAENASTEGRQVRMHVVEHDEGTGPSSTGTISTEWVVDVFNAPVPLSEGN
jgi:hypothetical protein